MCYTSRETGLGFVLPDCYNLLNTGEHRVTVATPDFVGNLT